MIRAAAVSAIVLLLAVPALAQDATAAARPQTTTAVAPDTDKHLWCASAFYWLAGSAEDSGDSEEAEMYDRWSKRLLEIASATLTAEGVKPDTIETMVANYDEKALVDLAGTAPPYDVATCPSLLGEFR
jgi:hypothetical protein